MSYSDKQIMSKLKKVRDKAADELERIVCHGTPVDQKKGWAGYAKCQHCLQGVQFEIERQYRLETVKRENSTSGKDGEKIIVEWAKPDFDENELPS